MKIAFSGQGPIIPVVRNRTQPLFGDAIDELGGDDRSAQTPSSQEKIQIGIREQNALLRSIRNWGVGLGISILSVLGVNTAHNLHEAHLDRDVKAVERMTAAQQRQMLEMFGPLIEDLNRQLMPPPEGAFPQGSPGQPEPLPPWDKLIEF